MENLINILKEFDSRRTEMIKKEEKVWDDNAVTECFEPCAKEILLNGYFLINKEYIIDLGSIELYYHEEAGPIKDYIMYHRKERTKSKIKELNNGELPYFEFGSLNLHQSGVDVTFENEGKGYRASFLIRSYRVLRKNDNISNDIIYFDPHSTHIFDDMFFGGILFNGDKKTTIEWIKLDKGKDVYNKIVQIPRQNVAEYTQEMRKVEIAKDEIIHNEEILRINGINYRRDMRPWQFKRLNIKEK